MKLLNLISRLTLTFLLILTLVMSLETRQLQREFVPLLTEFSQVRWAKNPLESWCLAVRDGATSSNAVIEITFCTAERHKLWQEIIRSTRLNGPVHLRARHSGKCLTSKLNRDGVFQSDCDERNLQQLWRVKRQPEPSSLVVFESQVAKKCMGALDTNPPTLDLRPCGGSGQEWHFDN